MKLPAPAKVNLHLRILGQRADGFHNIETLMVPVTLADEITVQTSRGRTVRVFCDNPDVPQGEHNLAARAAQEFSRQTGREFAARIDIVKRIPMGAGLGGGSSDAATVLIALDSIFETRLGMTELQRMAAHLGSDVPFFIRHNPAWCRGRGEIMEACEVPEKLPLLLMKPSFGVETPWAYKNWAVSRELPGCFEQEQDLGWVKIFNALERPVFEKFLVLPLMKQWLIAQPEVRVAAMSGSGSTLFAVLKAGASCEALAARVKESFGPGLWTAFCETLQ
ncbi:MAG: 4-(cytidine 5'-diphospho)-2-C-methyl-D-erythritol kinase [Verrucomicrobiota bacterium]